EERAAIMNEEKTASRTRKTQPTNGSAQMLIKRSVSPDGRIDALSVEFSCPVEKVSVKEVESRAEAILKLQNGIVEQFLNGKGNGSKVEPTRELQETPDESLPARMLSIGGIDGKWGRRLFITVDIGERRLRLYGNRKQLTEHLVAAGFPKLAERIE